MRKLISNNSHKALLEVMTADSQTLQNVDICLFKKKTPMILQSTHYWLWNPTCNFHLSKWNPQAKPYQNACSINFMKYMKPERIISPIKKVFWNHCGDTNPSQDTLNIRTCLNISCETWKKSFLIIFKKLSLSVKWGIIFEDWRNCIQTMKVHTWRMVR